MGEEFEIEYVRSFDPHERLGTPLNGLLDQPIWTQVSLHHSPVTCGDSALSARALPYLQGATCEETSKGGLSLPLHLPLHLYFRLATLLHA